MSFQFHISTINGSNIQHIAIGIDIIKILLKHRRSDAATCSVPSESGPSEYHLLCLVFLDLLLPHLAFLLVLFSNHYNL